MAQVYLGDTDIMKLIWDIQPVSLPAPNTVNMRARPEGWVFV